jgi:glycosyltransferase involved in cell wall biosynthesis
VDLIGEVRDVAEWICRAVLSVVPLRFGAGTRIKILESLGLGRAVVSTTVGAEGYPHITEEHGLIRRDTPEEFALAVAESLANTERTLSLGAAGRRHVEAHYTWEKTTAPLVSDLDGWLNGHSHS